MTRLLNKVSIITGAAQGIGLATALKFAAEGAIVVVCDLRQAGVDAAVAQCKALGAQAIGCLMDVTDREMVDAVVAQVKNQFGRIDVLVNNAGITRDTTFRKMDLDAWHAVINTNLDSVFNMTKPVIDAMAERGWGRIINVSSVNGQKGAFGQTNYSAAKAGMHGFTKAAALEYAKKGVTVNTISPGYIGTKMVMAIPKEVLDSKIIPQIPVGRLGKPEEVAGLVAYLCSEEAAFVTGANIAINGGQHMQ
jgi:acetoacetyl-CoA reductase